MSTGKREDPLAAASFHLDVSGKITGTFRECSGLGSESDVIEQKAAAKNGHVVVQKIPGGIKYQDIVLKRGDVVVVP